MKQGIYQDGRLWDEDYETLHYFPNPQKEVAGYFSKLREYQSSRSKSIPVSEELKKIWESGRLYKEGVDYVVTEVETGIKTIRHPNGAPMRSDKVIEPTAVPLPASPVSELDLLELLKALVKDCMASDFNEHWDSYKNAIAFIEKSDL